MIAGEVEPDSVRSLDSLYVSREAELLAAKSQIEADFAEYYESKGKDQLSLFDMAITQTDVQTLVRPVSGVVVGHFSETENNGITIVVPKKEKVMAVLSGTVVTFGYTMSNDWYVIMQHDGDCLSLYSGMDKPVVRSGARLRAGDIIGVVSEKGEISMQLWQNGKAVNPESLIAF